MARKTRRKQTSRRSARPPQPAPVQAPARPAGPAASAAVGGKATVRAVEMSLAPRTTSRRGPKNARFVIEDSDPAIPLDRVPYFLKDLRNLGLTVAVMLALLVAGAQLIPHVVK